jgi:hypothetical protein
MIQREESTCIATSARMRNLAFVVAIAGASAACVADVPAIPADSDYPPEHSEAAGTNARQTAFYYFVSKGLTKAQSAGIVGNLVQESSVIPTSVQYGGGPGRGIAQWSVGGRWDRISKDNVTSFAAARGVSRWALTTQLDFIWYELETVGGYGLPALRATTTISGATVAFERDYEVCGTCSQTKRIAAAQQVYNDYAGTSGDGGGGTGSGSGGTTAGAECYSDTLAQSMPDNACVQSVFDNAWYQCANGSWVDRWSDPEACNGTYPL